LNRIVCTARHGRQVNDFHPLLSQSGFQRWSFYSHHESGVHPGVVPLLSQGQTAHHVTGTHLSVGISADEEIQFV
jgi:hypothetical protein